MATEPPPTTQSPSPEPPVPAVPIAHAHPILPKLKFLEELKRRNLGRVAILYVVIGYLILEVFGVFVHVLELPAWIGRSVALLMVLGFPVALLIAWIYEITPAGLKPTDEVPPQQSIRDQTGKRLDRAIIAALSVALAYFIVDKFWLSKHTDRQVTAAPTALTSTAASPATPAAARSDKSIAVLPFVDMSEKHDQEYFSDGLSEELIDHLAHNADLKVIARTSSFVFKGRNEDMRSIASKLGVANLLEGSVRKAGGTLRITVQLIRVSDGADLWSETYDRKLADIFKVQDEISTTVAKALNVALNATNAVGAQAASEQTTNIEAYNLVLQGNYFSARQYKGDNAKAVDLYQQALKLDSHYALAWARLATTYTWQGGLGELTAADAEVKGRDAVQRALAIDPNCAEAYFARGNIARLVLGDWAAAKPDYERALKADPHGAVGEIAQRNILRIEAAMSGRVDEIVDWARHHLERNPLDTDTMWNLVGWQQMAGHLDASVVTSRKLLDLNPAFARAQAQYAVTLLLMGNETEALAAAAKESDEAWRLAALTCIYWTMGQRAESASALGALERGFADRNQYQIAAAYAYRGEVDAAFAWLDRVYRYRKGALVYIRVDPLLRNLHSDPRFKALLRKLSLPE